MTVFTSESLATDLRSINIPEFYWPQMQNVYNYTKEDGSSNLYTLITKPWDKPYSNKYLLLNFHSYLEKRAYDPSIFVPDLFQVALDQQVDSVTRKIAILQLFEIVQNPKFEQIEITETLGVSINDLDFSSTHDLQIIGLLLNASFSNHGVEFSGDEIDFDAFFEEVFSDPNITSIMFRK